ncbi:hypothetical protein EDC01DRAFT_633276 [Geopyxis carbonaria]|nr:hypothetical protein EDC01DRAFT_633276 [Geopyxis carbonaria]
MSGEAGYLKKKYQVWARLSKLSGWGWDPATGALTASDQAWDSEIKANPSAEQFRYGALPYCLELQEIFQGVIATGDYVLYPAFNNVLCLGPLTKPRKSTDTPAVDPSLLNENNASSAGESYKQKKSGSRRESQMDRVEAAIQLATRVLTSDLSQNSGSGSSELTIIQRAIYKLKEVYRGKSDWTQEDLMDAYELVENNIKAEVFLSMDADLEEAVWLRRQIARYRNSLVQR